MPCALTRVPARSFSSIAFTPYLLQSSHRHSAFAMAVSPGALPFATGGVVTDSAAPAPFALHYCAQFLARAGIPHSINNCGVCIYPYLCTRRRY